MNPAGPQLLDQCDEVVVFQAAASDHLLDAGADRRHGRAVMLKAALQVGLLGRGALRFRAGAQARIDLLRQGRGIAHVSIMAGRRFARAPSGEPRPYRLRCIV
jgi:hypothetical protein